MGHSLYWSRDNADMRGKCNCATPLGNLILKLTLKVECDDFIIMYSLMSHHDSIVNVMIIMYIIP